MAKFCGKCGSSLNENGLCPKCNFDTPKKKNRKTLPLILAIVFCALLS